MARPSKLLSAICVISALLLAGCTSAPKDAAAKNDNPGSVARAPENKTDPGAGNPVADAAATETESKVIASDIKPAPADPVVKQGTAEAPASTAGNDNDGTEPQEPADKIYNGAAAKLNEGKYTEAAKDFDKIDQQYPYSQWATRAQLMSGFAQYKNLKYDEAVLALDRFIELHPGDENAPYAYYLKALCYYEQISDVRRDQKMTEQALDALRQVVDRFPESKYAKDAALKIDLTTDHLAGKEMEIGRYYEDRKQYQAAIGRFQKVVTQYQTTTHVPEALERLVESYLALGIPEEAKKNAAILGYNYPESSWYKDAYRLMGGALDVPPPQKSLYERTIGKIL